MDGRARAVLLAVLGTGVFLAGLELMVTAVALPSIVVDLASWQALREASWIINAYLLAYVVTMPLAGRLADQWGVRRLFLAGLAVFTLGSLLAGLAPSLETLIAARVVQAIGGGILVPVGTAAASHLFEAGARPRALGVIGALTFLGMAAGPFVGAWIIGGLHPAAALDGAGIVDGPLRDALEAPWRYVFYVNVPIGIAALGLAWAAAHGWETVRRGGPPDVAGAVAFSVALGLALIATTLTGSDEIAGIAADPAVVLGGLALSIIGLVRMSAWTPATELPEVALWMAAFGLGFGLTVTPRTTAAVDALGQASYGVASATVTVARMIGMAVGLAALTAFGSTTIDRLYREVRATPDAYRLYIPEALRDRPLEDGLVVEALEAWASGEAARILVGIFLVAALVTAVAFVPALALGRRRILAPGSEPDATGAEAVLEGRG